MKKNYYSVTIKANTLDIALDLYSNELTKKEFINKLKSYGYDEKKIIMFSTTKEINYIKKLDTLTLIFTIFTIDN
jgi:hypothetical protein